MDIPVSQPPNDSIAPKLLVPVGIIMGIGFPIYVTRIYSRVRPHNKLSWDDYSITLAEVCSIVGYALIVMSCKYGVGRHVIYVSKQDMTKNAFYFLLQIFAWYLGLAMMRVSVAFLLLRLKTGRAWKWLLWGIISSQVFVAVFGITWTLTACTPVRANWDPEGVRNPKCRPVETVAIWGYIYTGISVGVDLTFSLIPLTFVWRLRRPVFEKVVVGILMSMGLTATMAAIMRLSHSMFYHYDPDPLRNTIIGALWCKLEEVIGITAASIPYLKSPTEQLLRRLRALFPARQEKLLSENRNCPSFYNEGLESTRSNMAIGEIDTPRMGAQDIELCQAVIKMHPWIRSVCYTEAVYQLGVLTPLGNHAPNLPSWLSHNHLVIVFAKISAQASWD
ncbi:hypothetical protein B0O99DRAFT_725828 [Bisporella sp. PMI_857]|nr:hypothetical protein B0O99DRAFT_725828 [Bisporella sp. PMI_857]